MTIQKVIVTFGRTQVEKDTWIELFLNICTNPGEGFNSVTIYRGAINGVEYSVINLPGLDDNAAERFDEDFVLKQMQVVLVENNIESIDAVLLFESINNDAHSLSRCYDQLKRLFGNNISNSTLVVGNTLDISIQSGENEKKELLFGKECTNLGLLYTFWESFERPNQTLSNEMRNQLNAEIIQKMDKLKSYSMDRVQEIQELLKQRAQQLMRDTPLQTQNTTFEYTETEQIPYEVQEFYIEEYDSVEPYQVNRNIKRTRVEKQVQLMPVIKYETERIIMPDKKVGWLHKILFRKKVLYQENLVPHFRQVPVINDVPVEYDDVETATEYRTVKQMRTKERTVTKYRVQEVEKLRNELVEIPHVPEEFLSRVRKEWIGDTRAQIQVLQAVNTLNHQ